MGKTKKVRSSAIIGLKIAVGSSAAILIAELLGLESYTSAGIVTLLTLMTTKWESIRLSVLRIITYVMCIIIALIVFYVITIDWLAYGIYIFFLVFLTYVLGWTATISVNAVIGTHILMAESITMEFMINEFMIVLIGVVIALLLNLFHDYHHQKSSIVANMRKLEAGMQGFVHSMSASLISGEFDPEERERFSHLRKDLEGYINEARDYQDNTFHSHPGYYIAYFEMRQDQCNLLTMLFEDLSNNTTVPFGVDYLVEYMDKLAANIVEQYDPEEKIQEIHRFFQANREEGHPPRDMLEFESRALTYHILSTFEEFLRFKQKFINSLDERQIKEYRS